MMEKGRETKKESREKNLFVLESHKKVAERC
jgi:hypothetical protein